VTATRVAALPAVFAGRRRRWLLALVANGVARAVLAALVVLAVRSLLVGAAPLGGVAGAAAVFQGRPAAWTAAVVAVLVIVVLALAWLRQRETVDAEAVAQHYIAHVRLRMFDRVLSMTPAEAQRHSRGGVLMRFIGDVQALRGWVGRAIPSVLVSGGASVVLLGVLSWLNPPLAAAVVVLILCLLLVLMRLWPALYEATALARRRQAFIAANVQDKLAALPTLQVACRTAQERRHLQRQNARLRRALQQRARWRGWHRAVVAMATGGATVLMAGSAGWMVLRGEGWTHVGTVFGAAVIIGLLLTPLRELGMAAEVWIGARVARARVLAFLNGHLPSAGPSAEQAVVREGRTTDAEDDDNEDTATATWRSLPGPWRPAAPAALRPAAETPLPEQPEMWLQRPVLEGRVHGPLARLPHGRRVALMGPAASGKSSLLQLMSGLQRPTSGAVLLGGQPLSALSGKQLRRHLGLLSPDLPLLRGSVGENLHYQAGSVAPQALWRALALSGLGGQLAQLPDGLDTQVRDGGSNLSHGQRRAVQLARALAGRPSVLLIDDAEACLPGPPLETLRGLLAGWPGTVVFATSDPALAALADEVWPFGGQCGARLRPCGSRTPAILRAWPTTRLQ